MWPASIAPFFRATPLLAQFFCWQFAWIVWSEKCPFALNLHRVQLRDPPFVPAAFKWRLQPHPDNCHRHIFGNHALPEREDVRVVMLTRKPSDFLIPAQRTAHATHFVCDHRFTVS